MSKEEIEKATANELFYALRDEEMKICELFDIEKTLYCGEDLTKEEIIDLFGIDYFLEL